MTNTEVAPTPVKQTHPAVILRQRLEERMAELKTALPSDIKPELFVRSIMTAVAINPDILGCSWNSLWIACMKACRDGLLPDGVEGALVPYKSQCTWIPMVQGLLRRFRKSGQLKYINADVVRVGDEYDYYIDEYGPHFKHRPGDNPDAPIVRIYAMAITMDGATFVSVLSIAEANKIRAESKAIREDSPWKKWPSEMYKKTALRRLSKLLPTGRDAVPPDEGDDNESVASHVTPLISGGAAETFSIAADPEPEEEKKPVTPENAVVSTLEQFAKA